MFDGESFEFNREDFTFLRKNDKIERINKF